MVGRQLRRRWCCPRCGDLGARSGGGPGAAGPSSEWRPGPDLDADTARFDRLDQAIKTGDLDEQNRLATWLWLDGPAQPEGRVGGRAAASCST